MTRPVGTQLYKNTWWSWYIGGEATVLLYTVVANVYMSDLH